MQLREDFGADTGSDSGIGSGSGGGSGDDTMLCGWWSSTSSPGPERAAHTVFADDMSQRGKFRCWRGEEGGNNDEDDDMVITAL